MRETRCRVGARQQCRVVACYWSRYPNSFTTVVARLHHRHVQSVIHCKGVAPRPVSPGSSSSSVSMSLQAASDAVGYYTMWRFRVGVAPSMWTIRAGRKGVRAVGANRQDPKIGLTGHCRKLAYAPTQCSNLRPPEQGGRLIRVTRGFGWQTAF